MRVCPQKAVSFNWNDSLKYTIRGNLMQQMKENLACIRIAQAKDFVSDTKGLDSHVRTRRRNFSGGSKNND